ncbi:MAG TPA: response regulator [Opitutaceae bacterium]|nr:response regulator [Opitutaceae bacterium]
MGRRDILIVENNSDDLFFLKRALRSAGITDPIQSVVDGRSAIAYLSGDREYNDRTRFPLPWLIFLDLKLPYKTGIEVLEYIRGNPELQKINVVVVTSSEDDKDMKRTTELGVNAYLLKPPTAYVLQKLFASPQLSSASGSGDKAGKKGSGKFARNPWRYLYEAPPREMIWLILAAAIGVMALVMLVRAVMQ